MQQKSAQPKTSQSHSRLLRHWGPVIFLAALLGVLGFFYWLLIYSGGVGGHGG